MSFLKRALLTAAVAAVGLAGSLVAPSPASAATVGTAAFQADMHLAQLGGGAAISHNIYCVDSTGPGFCEIHASGDFTGQCGIGSGRMWGNMNTSNGHAYSIEIAYTVAGTGFQSSGSFYNHHTGESGPFAINGATVTPSTLSLQYEVCPYNFFLTGAVTFGGV